MSDWLEVELTQHLAPVEAPADLWERVRPGAWPEPPGRSIRAAWPIAALIMILIALGTLLLVAKGEQPAPETRHLAQEQPGIHDASCLTCHTNL